MKKTFKVIGITVNVVLVLIVYFFAIEFIAFYNGSRELGYSKVDSYKYAMNVLKEEYARPVNDWIIVQIKKNEEVIEYPIVNKNIDWNSLGREP